MRWLNRDPIEEAGGVNLYGFCLDNPLCKYDKDGRMFTPFSQPGGGWSFKVLHSRLNDAFEVEAKYTMTRIQRRYCGKVVVDRYVRKVLKWGSWSGIGCIFGPYYLDHSGDRESLVEDPYSGYAEGDRPDGQNFLLYRLRWMQAFKFVARCVKGCDKGKVLSTVEKKFVTTGHWLWSDDYDGWFSDNYDGFISP